MADEIIEMTEVIEVVDGLSSPTNAEFEGALRGYSDTGVALAAMKTASEGGGGPGELPDWWTVDSTPGSESVEFAGAVEIEPGRDVSALVLRGDAGQTEHIMRVYRDDGDLCLDIDASGNIDALRLVLQEPPDTGGGAGTSSSHMTKDQWRIASGTDASVHPLQIDRWDGVVAFSSVFTVGRTGAIVRTGPPTTASNETSWEITASADFTGNAIELWDNNFNNQLFTLGYAGWVDMFEQTEPAAPAANTGRLFVKDTGGKSQLLVRFPSGASQVIATEP